MKFNIYIKTALLMAAAGSMTSCNDFLDKEPTSQVTPEKYFNDEASLQYYANNMYTILTSHGNWSYGMYGNDNNTDNQIGLNYSDIFVPGKWKTSLTDDSWTFTNINTINYFFDEVLPKYEAGAISGNAANIKRYIGEMYFFRAYQYYSLLRSFGDFPIIEHALSSDDEAALVSASKRYPRNEVARFILKDLDRAYELIEGNKAPKTRLNADVVKLFKSRVALFEGSWLKNFAGTAFVPGSQDWPGKDKNPDFAYPTGSVEAEANWFFEQAISAAKDVADAHINGLAQNTGKVPGDVAPWDDASITTVGAAEALNPWLAMFGTMSLENYDEVLMWRQYSQALGVVHNVVVMAQRGNYGIGVTRGLVDAFPMANGLPIYASNDYKGDNTIHDVRTDRDPRLFVLLKEPGQKNVLVANSAGSHANPTEGYPNILESNAENNYATGYALRKGNYYDAIQCSNGNNYTACPVFRSVEALLNYIEAYYERYGNLDANADRYWKAIRGRHAGMDTDYQKTIGATDMSQGAKGDWGAYTAGQLIDQTRYNIRRERRLELIADGLRYADLCRWRAMDQMITTGYHTEGFHIWNTPMQEWYKGSDDADPYKKLRETISSSSISEYYRPHESKTSSEVMGGLKWTMAQYLRPVPIKEMMLTAPDHTTPSLSIIHQNPYWPSEPNMAATK